MGCWAVPSVAADIWGVSVQEVQRAIAEGRVISRLDSGLIVVDVEPAGMPASRRRNDLRPLTYRLVDADESSPRPIGDHAALTFREHRQTASLVRRPPCVDQPR